MKKQLIFLSVLAGCVASYQPISTVDAAKKAEIQTMSEIDFCSYLLISEGVAGWSDADASVARQELARRGFSSRDAELIARQGTNWGTGMSYRGLKCTNGRWDGGFDSVNKAFYPGLGHQWQVDMGNFDFVYLKGDGTDGGMRVHAWN